MRFDEALRCVALRCSHTSIYSFIHAQFATNEEGKFKCHCGAKTCRGSLAPKPRYTEDEEIEMLRQGGSRCVSYGVIVSLLGVGRYVDVCITYFIYIYTYFIYIICPFR